MSAKTFSPAPRGPWRDVSDTDWQDWTWQLRHRLTRLEDLEPLLELTPEERAGVILSRNKLALAITPHFFSLIDRDDPSCPIRRQVIPRIEETTVAPEELADPCGEDGSMPVPGLVHRYPDRVLFLVTDRCASYCRYCTRSRVVSGVGEQELETDFDQAFHYLETHSEVRDVLLSGGDPLLFSDRKLEGILARLRAIPHLEFIRIGSRVPIFLPQRITSDFVAMIRKYHPVWMSIHSNHPRELTAEVRTALERLADAGIPLGNQAVLLRGVNDRAEILKELFHKLLLCRVRPYYLYQCDLIEGSAHLRTSIREGLDIMDRLRGHTTGYAVPQYVVDGPGGGGKIPLNPNYIVAEAEDRFVLRNFKGDIYEYPTPSPAIRPTLQTTTPNGSCGV
ncbi:MAG: lysine 2,3-aminomutase [Candidatus Methylacidiphilales bacterium]